MRKIKFSLLIFGVILLFAANVIAGQNAGAKYNIDFDIVTEGNQKDIINNDLDEGDPAVAADKQVAFAVYIRDASNVKSFDLRVTFDDNLLTWDPDNSGINVPAIILLNGEVVQPAVTSNFLTTDLSIVGLVPDKTNEITVSRTLSGEVTADDCPDGEGLLYFFVFKTNVDFPENRATKIILSQLQVVDVEGNTDSLLHNFFGYINRNGVGVETTTWSEVKKMFQ